MSACHTGCSNSILPFVLQTIVRVDLEIFVVDIFSSVPCTTMEIKTIEATLLVCQSDESKTQKFNGQTTHNFYERKFPNIQLKSPIVTSKVL